MTTDDSTHNAALAMLRAGLATPAEVAQLAGRSRQIVLYWANAAGIDWQKARTDRLLREWSRRTG